METFKIVRTYFSGGKKTIRTGLTRDEAEEHCGDSETSSTTCHEPANVAHTKKHGKWFDGFETE